MNLDAQQIDRIVRDVIRQLATADASEPSIITDTTALPEPSSPADTLSIDERLITMASLHGRLTGLKHLQVNAKAVVTPSVVDLLRDRGIVLQRRATTSQSHHADKVRVGICIDRQSTAKLTPRLSQPAVDWCVMKNCEEALAAIGDSYGRLVVVTADWAKLVCQANRRPEVNAVSVSTVECVRQSVCQVDPTVLVINANNASVDQQAAIIDEFIHHLL